MHYVILDMIFACIYAWDPRMTCNRACIYTIYPERKVIRLMLNEITKRIYLELSFFF